MLLKKNLSNDAIEAITAKVVAASDEFGYEAAWKELQPLLDVQQKQKEVATCLLRLIEERRCSVERSTEVLKKVIATYSDDVEILSLVGSALESARDIDELNAPPPNDPLFQNVVNSLVGLVEKHRGSDSEVNALSGLACAARMMGRQQDVLAEHCCKRLIEIDPRRSSYHYNLGLFYKTRGHFSLGLVANQLARELEDEPSESVSWNLGICATGAGEGSIALDVWKKIGQRIEMGRFNLPEGAYPQCKVKLAEHPLAERSAIDDAPGNEETIWIERLSPCHGIVRSVLYQQLGVDYGDVILMDGAPITYHKYGDTEVPVFPHLATLVRNNYSFYNFAGTQDESGRIYDASTELDDDIVIYPHSENFRTLCSNCWNNPELDHEHHEESEKHVVTGRIAAPSGVTPSELLEQLDKTFERRRPCRIYVPELCQAAGRSERIEFEKRRFEMLSQS